MLPKCCIFGLFFYIYSARALKYLESCEMWFYCRMLKIPCLVRMTNETVL